MPAVGPGFTNEGSSSGKSLVGLCAELLPRQIGELNLLVLFISTERYTRSVARGSVCGLLKKSLSDLETAAQTTVVIDGEGSDKVNGSGSAESYTETFCDVHGRFATVSLTECNFHACQR